MELLTRVKGIGRWTVDMLMLFHLGRSDVLPVGDLGIRKNMQVRCCFLSQIEQLGCVYCCLIAQALFNLKELPKPKEMEALTQHWRPYRSVGCFYLWRTGDKDAAVAGQDADVAELAAPTSQKRRKGATPLDDRSGVSVTHGRSQSSDGIDPPPAAESRLADGEGPSKKRSRRATVIEPATPHQISKRRAKGMGLAHKFP